MDAVRCPRCEAMLIREYDDAFCLLCGFRLPDVLRIRRFPPFEEYQYTMRLDWAERGQYARR